MTELSDPLLDRIHAAEDNLTCMAAEWGLDRWTAMSSMALAFYALRQDDPESGLEENLRRISAIVDAFKDSRETWGSGPANGTAAGFGVTDEEWPDMFMTSQMYLQAVIQRYFENYEGVTAVAEIGNHLNFNLAAAMMSYDDIPGMVERCSALARDTVAFAKEHCTQESGPEL